MAEGKRKGKRKREGREAGSLALALALALVTLVPSAVADHVFTHRVYVAGRVIDAEERPAAGIPIALEFGNLSAPYGCFDNDPEVTGPRGDFLICRHAHAIPEDATVTVRAGNVSRTLDVDPQLRHASVHIKLDAVATRDLNADRRFGQSFLVVGRTFALLADPVEEEGIAASAVPMFNNVTVELRVLDRVIASGTAKPNEHGLYRVDLDVGDIPPTATVRARVGSDIGEDSASPIFRRADVNVIRDLRLVNGPGDDAPGSAPTPLGFWPLALALTLAIVARGGRSRSR